MKNISEKMQKMHNKQVRAEVLEMFKECFLLHSSNLSVVNLTWYRSFMEEKQYDTTASLSKHDNKLTDRPEKKKIKQKKPRGPW